MIKIFSCVAIWIRAKKGKYVFSRLNSVSMAKKSLFNKSVNADSNSLVDLIYWYSDSLLTSSSLLSGLNLQLDSIGKLMNQIVLISFKPYAFKTL